MTVYSFHAMRDGRAVRHYFGLKPPQPEAIKFKLGEYLDLDEIPPPPLSYGYISNATYQGMLGNDQAGCCVVSGAAHEIMTWTKAASGTTAAFHDSNVLDTYKAVTGWDGVTDSASDTGLDMQSFAEYRRTVGLRDANNVTHRILAYAEIGNDVDSIVKAAYVFGAVGVGLRMPQSTLSQFSSGVPWSPISSSGIVGGHYVPVEGRNHHGNLVCVTWGKLQAMTPPFITKYCDVAVAYITEDFINGGLTPRGFDVARLNADLSQLKA
jgi:hypothetical protein